MSRRHSALASPYDTLPPDPGPVRHQVATSLPILFTPQDGKHHPCPAEWEGLIQSGVAVRASASRWPETGVLDESEDQKFRVAKRRKN